ncbi:MULTISPECIES: helix-turn-helix domain-containing protein [unclassified Mycolicibacterium]|uniref:winged helix-turn-helix transcriptional regulator n=1 Tax=unclassified Mycolicibacterium TaxID=2636767 RepID=UPI0012DE8905|nr:MULTISPECIES: helix-turn-helix domain-containing protein [unclassified Mycolicibacterium]MUL81501.1 helix-turn-helix transcriptional regulator [Mycolicibacterium sp. CBMA 329]MUL87267.1 helix-turn-helix transcriptional regulator [Mycolicibacterium sp. CBMA 331]MUL98451.1 helix-turn-helix transcriptional regulator [Mycolicibacterium sp. CBMA 334]MUM25210.1 helix-turn-helix transcriptional regulator [Mycolicibacterium sp. CBMA 295]MUM37564.1 helix-turn-helix transcriptional regulator [Mycolic
MPVSKKEIGECPIDATLSVIDGRWKGTILWRLADGPMRTAELRRSIPDITERTLIRHLHDLVEAGIIDRHDAGTVPPCVHYSISEYGRTLAPVLHALCEWGRTHMEIQKQRPQRTRAAAPTRPASPPSSAGTTRSPRRKSSPA